MAPASPAPSARTSQDRPRETALQGRQSSNGVARRVMWQRRLCQNCRFGVCCVFVVTTESMVVQNCTYIQNEGFPTPLNEATAQSYTVQRCNSGELGECSVWLPLTLPHLCQHCTWLTFGPALLQMFAFSDWTLTHLISWALEALPWPMRELVSTHSQSQ